MEEPSNRHGQNHQITAGALNTPYKSRPATISTVSNENHLGTTWQSRRGSNNSTYKDRAFPYNRQYSYGHDDSSFQSDAEREESCTPYTGARVDRQQYARAEQRTILLKNLSDRVTHKDIVEVIRGGALLDIYLRSTDRTANVSFVEGVAAQEFMNHVRRNDIYIHGKRVGILLDYHNSEADHLQVEFAWNERQFVLPPHVAGKIAGGATRNVIINSVHPNITAEMIRNDLDHIHNLVVIDIAFRRGDALISLNSVHNSLFARTCMMSRSAYKGMRIEWYQDECALALPKLHPMSRRENLPKAAKKVDTTINRFQMLNMDGTENGSEEEDTETEDEMPAFAKSNNHRAPTIST